MTKVKPSHPLGIDCTCSEFQKVRNAVFNWTHGDADLFSMTTDARDTDFRYSLYLTMKSFGTRKIGKTTMHTMQMYIMGFLAGLKSQ